MKGESELMVQACALGFLGVMPLLAQMTVMVLVMVLLFCH